VNAYPRFSADHAVPAMWRSLAAARLSADWLCDAGAPPDLTQDALERIVRANPPPMLLRESLVGERLLDCPLPPARRAKCRPRSFSITRTAPIFSVGCCKRTL